AATPRTFPLSLHDALPIFGVERFFGKGILKTIDGGATWTNLAASTFAGRYIKSLIPTGLVTGGGEVILAATAYDGGGIYRSSDRDRKSTRLNSSHRTISYA